MGCHAIALEDGRAVLQDSVTGLFFGQAFDDQDQADAFVTWCLTTIEEDPRALDSETLLEAIAAWRKFA
jgi:hypothetical protein